MIFWGLNFTVHHDILRSKFCSSSWYFEGQISQFTIIFGGPKFALDHDSWWLYFSVHHDISWTLKKHTPMYDFPISFRFRDYCVFLNITYPEIAIPDGFQYTRIPGWESSYKTHVPFLSTVCDVVYPVLLEVLENDAKRLIHFMHVSLQLYFFKTSTFNFF